ncbi:MAG: transcriptional regulator [Alteromonadaceae bacterium]|uniref:FMN-binding negative transcriptional regulator n=1 Tax=Marinobacter sp. BGYM27 TaxID=2975597 RepID=UPI000C521507|nr:FMN-binding negative transcriptional regulator [Marinobacter sp. BGYM27]MAA63726.1 transcriptional regulator [Alteromonadaceae bacterium]MBH86536.1 transcriptional regulator [Alteromonadaceae bacterium]MDG5499706.1 FMN-binding negative transcriptional regulator [Marinobacter sp. BGYM27]|tara:strand:+ start:27760 stop:28386 length:627 start_codon:yes stop_codon:yes gene_type:complete
MYIPEHFREADTGTLQDLIQQRSFGTLVTVDEDGPVANHMPFVLDRSRGERGVLQCHVARRNPVWQALANNPGALILFQGPDAYISPNWYPSKQETGKAVPTWNYIAVHARGRARIMDDPEWLLHHLNHLTDQHERTQSAPWQVADAPGDYIEKMMGAIVGIEIPISTLTGKWKASQNQPDGNRQGVIRGLHDQQEANANAMANWVSR